MTNTTRNWSEQQVAIFNWFKTGAGNLVVRARAGTGKTTTIKEAFSHAPESKSLYCAFNTRNANEAKQAITDQRVDVKTLHGLGFAFIRYAWKDTKVDNDGQCNWDRARAACPVGAPDDFVALVNQLASKAKGCCPFADAACLRDLADDFDIAPEGDENGDSAWTFAKMIDATLKCLKDSVEDIKKTHVISFDDMVWAPLVCGLVRPWYSLVVVDEAQDMNYAQLLLAQKACKKSGRIVVVGDNCQAIYKFRGADAGSLDRLKSELKAVEMGLTITYRCPKQVVATAQRWVPDYQAAPTAPEGSIDSIGEEKLYTEAKIGDAILSRKNAPLASHCLRFLRLGIAARVEGKDIGRGLAAIAKKLKGKSVPDFLARLARWEEKQTARAVAGGKKIEEKTGLIKDQAETLRALADGAANVQEVVDRCFNLFADSADSKGNKPAIVLSTVHKAKGLEWHRVFILGETFNVKGDASEENNIKYVAVTRAKAQLTWVAKAF